MRLVNDNQVVVAPVNVLQVNVARQAVVTRQVGVVEHIKVKAVRLKRVAFVVGFVQRPVVAQALGHEYQHAVVAQLVVFDNGKGFKSFTQTHAVSQNAATKAVEFVDSSHHAIALKFIEFFPNRRLANACGCFDDGVFV